MKLSDRQAHLLFLVILDSCRIEMDMGGLNAKQRLQLANEILDQQSQDVVELMKEKPECPTTP